MDKITLYHYIFLGWLAAFIALAALAVILFFVLDIRGVIGFLSGRTARRRIEQMGEENPDGTGAGHIGQVEAEDDGTVRIDRGIMPTNTDEIV